MHKVQFPSVGVWPAISSYDTVAAEVGIMNGITKVATKRPKRHSISTTGSGVHGEKRLVLPQPHKAALHGKRRVRHHDVPRVAHTSPGVAHGVCVLAQHHWFAVTCGHTVLATQVVAQSLSLPVPAP